jgi:hypothetical protein
LNPKTSINQTRFRDSRQLDFYRRQANQMKHWQNEQPMSLTPTPGGGNRKYGNLKLIHPKTIKKCCPIVFSNARSRLYFQPD